MSNDIVPSIEILPEELFHRIFDNLDAQTILFSVRSVSRLFHSVVKTYNRYVLDFNLISKSTFHVLCRLIHPHNIISLILSNDERTSNQIDLFISLVNLQQLIQLRSLILLNSDECQLNFMLERINLKLLTSFSFSIREYDDRQEKTTTALLSSIVAQSTLRKLKFNKSNNRILKNSWPINCTIQHLAINSYISLDDLCKIIECSPHLHTLITEKFPMGMINNLTSIYFRQLTSLTIKEISATIDEVESFLSLAPSLTYLKLMGGKNMLDGKRWEQFIKINLPQLKKFEFYFSESRRIKQTLADLELIIASFQTPFWIEHKKWFITCECPLEYPKSIYLSSLPYCQASVYYLSKLEKISLSTYPMMMNNDLQMTDKINSLYLTLNKSTADEMQENKAIGKHPLFPKVTDIYLEFRENWPLLSLQSLFVFIDISRIVNMKMNSDYFNEYNQNIWMDIDIFMEQAHNLSSLIIRIGSYLHALDQTIENIYSILPRQVKHLEIPINSLEQIKPILERCENLSTIKFHNIDTELCENVINWFSDNTVSTACREGYKTVAVWLGKKKIEPNEISVRHKRIKLTENS